jgi:hypothetical protein
MQCKSVDVYFIILMQLPVAPGHRFFCLWQTVKRATVQPQLTPVPPRPQ